MKALLQFLERKGLGTLARAIEANPKLAAGIAVGTPALAAGGVAGAYAGSQATIDRLPHELLKKLGLSDETAGDLESAVADASAYAQKHPIAATAIGASALRGANEFGGSALDKFREMIGNVEPEPMPAPTRRPRRKER